MPRLTRQDEEPARAWRAGPQAPHGASWTRTARAGNQPGRHTLRLDRAQSADQWQDDGGEA
jgi:hypothetical protein